MTQCVKNSIVVCFLRFLSLRDRLINKNLTRNLTRKIMKNLIVAAVLASFFAATAANASSDKKNQFYVGVDELYSKTHHKMQYLPDKSDSYYYTKPTKGGNLGLGLSAGYKINVASFFIAPEVFYDYLNNSAPDFGDSLNAMKSELKVKDRYGAKLNLGYNIFPNLNAFVNLGFADVGYSNRDPSGASGTGKYSSHRLAPIYGVGLLYDLNNNWALRASYDRQKFNAGYYPAAYQQGSFRDVITLQVFKAGVVYSF